MIEKKFGHLRRSGKGETISECARQFMVFYMDGTKHSIARFGELIKDPGYAAVLERDVDSLISTTSPKRFSVNSAEILMRYTDQYLTNYSSGVLNRKNFLLLHCILIQCCLITMMQKNEKDIMSLIKSTRFSAIADQFGAIYR
ncbi:MAG: hypothetical protein GXY77_19415 [Fibrobacter sp.]|nr:hypothetical protein [Fibrobacter sp.]